MLCNSLRIKLCKKLKSYQAMVIDVNFQFNKCVLLTLRALISAPNHWLFASFMTLLAKLPCPAEQLLRSVVVKYSPVAEN